MHSLAQRSFLATIALLLFTACSHVDKRKQSPLYTEDDVLKGRNQKAGGLRSRWIDDDGRPSNVSVLMIPGSGNQTISAVRTGDGFKSYAKPFESGTVWQEKLARAGYEVLAYDKRLGADNLDVLSSDVDTACDQIRERFGSGQKIILWTSEQGTQVVLNSKCIREASALVLVSPIPDALDRVWIAGLKEAGFRNRAESLAATFESIRKGLFAPDAKVMGASLSFWKHWLELAKQTPKQLDAIKSPILFVVGQEDVLLGRYGRKVIENLVGNAKNRRLIVVPGADQNLLQKEALSQVTIETILGALGTLERQNG